MLEARSLYARTARTVNWLKELFGARVTRTVAGRCYAYAHLLMSLQQQTILCVCELLDMQRGI